MGLWLLTLLTPESLLFATGDLRRLFDLPTPLQFNPTRFVKVEAAIATSQVIVNGAATSGPRSAAPRNSQNSGIRAEPICTSIAQNPSAGTKPRSARPSARSAQTT